MISFSWTTICLSSVLRLPAVWALARNAWMAFNTSACWPTTASPRSCVQSRFWLIIEMTSG
jgi:hypothetical protein